MNKTKDLRSKGRKGYWARYNAGLKAAREEKNKPVTPEELLTLMPKWVRMFVKENKIDPGSLVISLNTPMDDMPHFIDPTADHDRELSSSMISCTITGRKNK